MAKECCTFAHTIFIHTDFALFLYLKCFTDRFFLTVLTLVKHPHASKINSTTPVDIPYFPTALIYVVFPFIIFAPVISLFAVAPVVYVVIFPVDIPVALLITLQSSRSFSIVPVLLAVIQVVLLATCFVVLRANCFCQFAVVIIFADVLVILLTVPVVSFFLAQAV